MTSNIQHNTETTRTILQNANTLIAEYRTYDGPLFDMTTIPYNGHIHEHFIDLTLLSLETYQCSN